MKKNRPLLKELKEAKVKFSKLCKLKIVWYHNTNKYSRTQLLILKHRIFQALTVHSTAEVVLQNNAEIDYLE